MRKVTGDVKQDAEIAGSNKRALIDSILLLADEGDRCGERSHRRGFEPAHEFAGFLGMVAQTLCHESWQTLPNRIGVKVPNFS